MIRLTTKQTKSLYLVFDYNGAIQLANACEQALIGEPAQIELDILSIKKGEELFLTVLEIKQGNDRINIKSHSFISVEINVEDLEYGAEKFLESSKIGYFQPAEFTILKFGAERECRDLYCEMEFDPAATHLDL